MIKACSNARNALSGTLVAEYQLLCVCEVEITSEPGGDRGGDGGGSICGGMGYFLGWFPLASSFLPAVGEPGAETADPDLSNCWLRRVIKLEP